MVLTCNELLNKEYEHKIFAHTSFKKKSETLIDHSKKTLEYCDLLIDKMNLKTPFNNMLSCLVSNEQACMVLEIIRSIICHHDLGKINPVFQKEKMNNDLEIETGKLNSHHSFYGKMLFDNLFLCHFRTKFGENMKDKKMACLFFILSQTIDRHHTSLRDINFFEEKICDDSVCQKLEDLNVIAGNIVKDWKDFNPETLLNCSTFKKNGRFDIYELFESEEQREALFYLYKTVYSLLIMSDYYATSDYMQDICFDKLSIITPEIIEKCDQKFYNFKFNEKLKDKQYCKSVLDLDIKDITELNDLRTKIFLESNDELEKILNEQPKQKVFYLNVPTGGGKTNISLKLVLTLLKSNQNIKRVFYVFPFINIIEQNHSVIKDTFGLGEKELSSIYSTSTWNGAPPEEKTAKEKTAEEEKNEEFKFILDNEFLNHPFVVMSNVNFFNAFIKSGRTSNYRLINLFNSIVILDEIQSLDDKSWTLFNDFIEYGSKYLNIYFIIMSATLPNLKMLSDTKTSVAHNLIKEPKQIFDHSLFKKRVSIEYRDDIKDLDGFVKILKDELKHKQQIDKKKILLVVNTIKTSLELYKKIKCNKEQIFADFSICLLNSTIIPYRRKEIIDEIKKTPNKIILVSTQSIEAGVDIDCDFGIRDFAIFDSIEQIAGRINRNSKDMEHTAKLIITNLHKEEEKIAKFIYQGSYRWNTMESNFSSSESVKEFLKERDFVKYYDLVLKKIINRNQDPIRKSSMDIVKSGIRGLNFKELDKIDIIKDDSITLLVNCELPKNEFSDPELKFIGSDKSDYISGKYVWSKYNEFLLNFKRGHVNMKINTKIWSSILSKFSINIRKPKNLEKINEGFPLLKDKFYSIEEGADPAVINSNSFDFLVKE